MATSFDDDDECWVPLAVDTNEEDVAGIEEPRSAVGTNSVGRNSSEQTHVEDGQSDLEATLSWQSVSNPNSSGLTVEHLRHRLETQLTLKKNLVDHPLDLFWKSYLVNLARQVWELDLHIRFGLFLVLTSLVMRAAGLCTWYMWYPQTLLALAAAFGGAVYLDLFDNFSSQLEQWCQKTISPDMLVNVLQQLDAQGLRLLALVLLLVPTVLETRTLLFLSHVHADTRWIAYNAIFSMLLFGFMVHSFHVKNIQPRECLYQGLILLYGSALFATIVKADLSKLPAIAPPFFSATGTLLITYRDDDMEWISKILRRALRLTLREVLSSMGEKVTEDEMLQLAMLRWIADYWASTPASTSTSNNFTSAASQESTDSVGEGAQRNPSASSSTNSSTSSDPGETSSTSHQTHNDDAKAEVSTITLPVDLRDRQLVRQNEVSWSDLFPMLSMAAKQMDAEIRALQKSAHMSNRVEQDTNPPTESVKSGSGTAYDAFQNFQVMLDSLQVDERAAPAVRAYKQVVESFPPDRKTAAVISVLRRCPAALALLWGCLTFSLGSPFVVTTLFPFVVLEYHRVIHWIHTCEEMKAQFGSHDQPASEEDSLLPDGIKDAGPMLVLLSGDSYNSDRPSTLLVVWHNVKSSVSALEMGLTAARCADATLTTVEFAGNVLSLLHLGYEIHQHGLLHGFGLMLKETVLLHTMDENLRHADATKYTNAAVGAVGKAQEASIKIQRLAEDHNVGPLVQPILHGVSFLLRLGSTRNGPKDSNINDELPESISSDSELTEDVQPHSEGPRNSSKEPFDLTKMSDLMDTLAEAYRNEEITESEKSFLCEKLATASSQKSLMEVSTALSQMIHRSRGLPISTEGLEAQHSPSALMELVLAAYYKGLIDVAEKNAFCAKIADLRAPDRCDPAVVGGMMRTLRTILENETAPSKECNILEGTTSPSPEDEVLHGAITTTNATSEVADFKSDHACSAVVEKEGRGSHESLQEDDRRGTDWIKFGASAVTALSALLYAKAKASDSAEDPEPLQTTEGAAQSTVEIEEIQDENEEDWVSVPQ